MWPLQDGSHREVDFLNSGDSVNRSREPRVRRRKLLVSRFGL